VSERMYDIQSLDIPEGASKLYMEYTLPYTIYIDEDINREDIVDWWVKYGTLFIEMKDGTVHEQSSEADWEQIDWKRGHMNLRWLDEEYQEVEA